MSKKLVEREYLSYLESELFYIKLYASGHLQERIEDLIKYVETNIYPKDRDSINETKRIAYRRMKNAKNPKENRMWYEFYKSLNADVQVKDEE